MERVYRALPKGVVRREYGIMEDTPTEASMPDPDIPETPAEHLPATEGATVLFRSATHVTRILAASVALTVILLVVTVFLLVGQISQNTTFRLAQQQQNTALQQQNTALHKSLVKACQDINVNKANDLQLWNDVLSTNHPKTAAQELTLENLKRLVNIRDQQVNCLARYG